MTLAMYLSASSFLACCAASSSGSSADPFFGAGRADVCRGPVPSESSYGPIVMVHALPTDANTRQKKREAIPRLKNVPMTLFPRRSAAPLMQAPPTPKLRLATGYARRIWFV
jgi:hypothetical protein